jgi:hypothetical protein
LEDQVDNLCGGTSGSVHVKTFNDNLKELEVIESKRNAIRKGLYFYTLTLRREMESEVTINTKNLPWTRYFKGWATLSNASTRVVTWKNRRGALE